MFNFFQKKKKEPKSQGARLVNLAYDDNRPNEFDNMEKIAEDKFNVAYRDKNDRNKIKIGIAGSNSLDDALTDANLFFGKKIEDTDRYKQSHDFVKKITEGLSNPDVELFGHSLSGTIVNQLQKEHPEYTSTAYNPYLINTDQIATKTKNLRTATDPASMLVAFNENVKSQVEGSSLNPLDSHSLTNFKKGGLIKN